MQPPPPSSSSKGSYIWMFLQWILHQMNQTLTGYWIWNNMPTSTNILLHIWVSTVFFDIVMLAWRLVCTRPESVRCSTLLARFTHTVFVATGNAGQMKANKKTADSRRFESWEVRLSFMSGKMDTKSFKVIILQKSCIICFYCVKLKRLHSLNSCCPNMQVAHNKNIIHQMFLTEF